MKTNVCAEHSGCEARIQHLELTLDSLGEDMKQLNEKLNDLPSVEVQVEKKINKIYLGMIGVLLTLVANLGIMLLKIS